MTEVSSPPEYASTTFFTEPTDPSFVRSMWNATFENGHLQVKAVLRLVEHGGLRTLHHLVRDLLPAVGGKAVHDDRVPVRDRQQAVVDPESAESPEPPLPLLLLSHARPDVGVENVRAPGRIERVPHDPHLPPAGPRRLPADRRGGLEPLRAGQPPGEPEGGGG